jgi:hypothetical protein
MTDIRHWISLIEQNNFAAWFRQSKVVDTQGKPLVVYHGTFRDFDEFYSGSHFGDHDAANQRITNTLKSGERGVWWSHDGAIMPVFLSIQNPLRIVDDRGLDDGFDLSRAVLEARGITTEDHLAICDTGSPGIAKRRLFSHLKQLGYDGLVYRNAVEGDADSWVPFDPWQVKSVYAKTFDPNSSKIMEHTGTYYSCYLLDRANRRKLMKVFQPKYNLVAHHVTHEFGVSEQDVPPSATLCVVGYVDDGSLEALIVEVNGSTRRPDGGTYHLTWSKTKERRANDANDILGNATEVAPMEFVAEPACLQYLGVSSSSSVVAEATLAENQNDFSFLRSLPFPEK